MYQLASTSWDDAEIRAIQDVIASGRWTMGERVQEFERMFAQKFGARHALMATSGSMANLLGVAALCYRKERPLRPGDEVIVPAVSWATTYYPLQQYGLRLRFVDVELDSINIDADQLADALGPRTRMVVAVSILGNPAALDRIREFCDAHDLILFEDNCESMGATLNGRYTGTFGHIGTFSMFFSHQMSTGEGGVLITEDEEIYQLAKSMRAHGWTRDLPEDNLIFDTKQDDFFEAYRFILPGYNARPLEISGAIGLEQLKKLDDMVAIRRSNARHFVSLFGDDNRFIIQREHGESSWFSFTIIINPDAGIDRADVVDRLKAASIEFRIITGGCFLRHDVIRYFDYDVVGTIHNANIVHDQGFFVGNHPRDIKADIDHLHKTLTESI